MARVEGGSLAEVGTVEAAMAVAALAEGLLEEVT